MNLLHGCRTGMLLNATDKADKQQASVQQMLSPSINDNAMYAIALLLRIIHLGKWCTCRCIRQEVSNLSRHVPQYKQIYLHIPGDLKIIKLRHISHPCSVEVSNINLKSIPRKM